MTTRQPPKRMTTLSPAREAIRRRPYLAPERHAAIDLHLDSNEGSMSPSALLDALAAGGPEVLHRYPDRARLEARIAARLDVCPKQVLVTAGGDDALDRACRAMLAPGREIIVPAPTFEMISRYAQLAGAEVVTPSWLSGEFPLNEVLATIGPRTAAIAVVSPNNPTGAVVRSTDLRRLSEAAPQALLIVDLAYVEFADEDLTAVVLELPNTVAVRTLSKAWGLAGLRVGYAVGPEEIIDWLRASGGPYAVSGPSLAMAEAWLETGTEVVESSIGRIRDERRRLSSVLRALDVDPFPSQANFVLARFADACWVRDALAGLGIAIRVFDGRPDLTGLARITCPGDQSAFNRLLVALRTVLAPQAILLDLDGVLADVSGSYREAILATARSFGAELDRAAVTQAKAAGNANNDWGLTHCLLAENGVDATLSEVTERFEELYQGTPGCPGMREAERLTVSRERLVRWAARYPLAVVTGRPRADCDRFLAAAGISEWVTTTVCMGDAPAKPDPAPVRLAMRQLNVERAWMVGDTPDDICAARRAGVVPLGVVAPGDDRKTMEASLTSAGTARVLADLSELEDLLP